MKILSKSRSGNLGFTLIEIMLVLAIVALLVGAGVYRLRGVTDTGKITAARTSVAAFETALQGYRISGGFLPTTEQGLKALVIKPSTNPVPRSWQPRLKGENDLLDPWQHPYQYRRPGLKGDEYDVWSFGPDGVESSDDIGNWE